MDTVADGSITVSYRPLATMDDLHVLLLAAVAWQTGGLSLLERVFSLPSNVLVKELAVLETYGLAQRVGDEWTATSRGQRVTTVWNIFHNRSEAEVPASGRQWLLGPGEFAVDEMIRDRSEVAALAASLGITDARSAVTFLDERRRAAEQFEAFVLDWPSQAQEESKHGVFGEALVFDHLRFAETDAALTRMKELLAAHVAGVVERCEATENSAAEANGSVEGADTATKMRRQAQEVSAKFENARRTQRKSNWQLAKVRATCEALLAGQWLSANVGSLLDAFNAEPAAFVFRSTVPLVAPEAANPPQPQGKDSATWWTLLWTWLRQHLKAAWRCREL
jgi:hypothetical protein